MKVILVNGSPHKEGCTFTALSTVASILESEGIESEIFHIGTNPIRGCTDCMNCKQTGSCRCIFGEDKVNQLIEKMESADGVVLGAPVHYASPCGAMIAFCDRVFYAGGKVFAHKPGASVVAARRAGTTASLDVLNKYFQINGMPIVPSKYWPMVHGLEPSDVKQDLEGMQTMRMLGRNMAWMIKSFSAAKDIGLNPPKPEDIDERTHFIR